MTSTAGLGTAPAPGLPQRCHYTVPCENRAIGYVQYGQTRYGLCAEHVGKPRSERGASMVLYGEADVDLYLWRRRHIEGIV